MTRTYNAAATKVAWERLTDEERVTLARYGLRTPMDMARLGDVTIQALEETIDKLHDSIATIQVFLFNVDEACKKAVMA